LSTSKTFSRQAARPAKENRLSFLARLATLRENSDSLAPWDFKGAALGYF